MDRNQDIGILSETKKECTQEVLNVLTPCIRKYFGTLYDEVVVENKVHRFVLRDFQRKLAVVSRWSDEDKRHIHETVKEKADWFDHLVNTLLVAKSKLLAFSNRKDQIPSVPMKSTHEFVADCYLNAARDLWRRPELFYHRVSKAKVAQHDRELEDLIQHSIKHTIHAMAPIKNVMKNDANTGLIHEINVTDKHTEVKFHPEKVKEMELFDEMDTDSDDEDEDADDDDEDDDDDEEEDEYGEEDDDEDDEDGDDEEGNEDIEDDEVRKGGGVGDNEDDEEDDDGDNVGEEREEYDEDGDEDGKEEVDVNDHKETEGDTHDLDDKAPEAPEDRVDDEERPIYDDEIRYDDGPDPLIQEVLEEISRSNAHRDTHAPLPDATNEPSLPELKTIEIIDTKHGILPSRVPTPPRSPKPEPEDDREDDREDDGKDEGKDDDADNEFF